MESNGGSGGRDGDDAIMNLKRCLIIDTTAEGKYRTDAG